MKKTGSAKVQIWRSGPIQIFYELQSVTAVFRKQKLA